MREKQNLSGNLKSEDFAGNQEPLKIFGKTLSNEVQISGSYRFFESMSPKVSDGIPNFREVFYLRMVLLKQCLLDLLTP